MKIINKILFITMLFGVAFSMIACKGSSDDATGGGSSSYNVTFDSNYMSSSSTKNTEIVLSGETVEKPATDPTISSYQSFVGWSTSKDSFVPYDFNLPVTSDLTLYAVYSAELKEIWTEIQSCYTTNSTVAFQTKYQKPFVFTDGSLYGVEVYVEQSSPSSGEKKLVKCSYSRTGSNSIYFFEYKFDSPLEKGKYNIYVKTINEISKKDAFEVTHDPAPAKNLKTECKDSYVKEYFTPAEGWSKYEVICYNGQTEIAKKSITALNTSETFVEFFGLSNDTEYTFKVNTVGTTASASVSGTPKITKKSSDILMIMYMDGDNNLNDAIYLDMNEAEYGLYKIRDNDGNPKTGYQDVNVVVLWDGCASYKQNNQTKYPQLLHAGSYIYELGTDISAEANYTYDPGCVLSENTKNLSYTADSWLLGTKAHDVGTLSEDSYGEVNMGSKTTLTNFLKWVQKRYEADNVILQFSNHGGGPRSKNLGNSNNMIKNINLNKSIDNTSFELKMPSDKSIIKTDLAGQNLSKAMCWDETSNNVFLKSKDVSDALKDAGYGSSNKLSLLLFDLCLGAALEDAYQFRNYADYMVASPNTIPGAGFEYTNLISSFESGKNIVDIGEQLIQDYMEYYSTENIYWFSDTIATLSEFDPSYENINSYTAYMVNVLNFFSAGGAPTLSLFDLSKVEAVANAVNNMASTILNAGTYTDSGKTYKYSNLFAYCCVDFPGWNHPGYTIWYEGTYGWLNDLGYLIEMTKNNFGNSDAVYYNSDIYNSASKVQTALSKAIIKSNRFWFGLDSSSNGLAFTIIDKDDVAPDCGMGMTISGAHFKGQDSQGNIMYECADWYKTDLDFGNGAWGQLLSSYYNN